MATTPATPVAPDALKERTFAAIDQARRRELRTDNGFWTIFHALLGLGPSVQLKDPVLGLPVNALDYVRNGGRVRGMFFLPTEDGVEVEGGETFVAQGHQDQFIAEMSQWKIPVDLPFTVNNRKYTFNDFVKNAQARASVIPKPGMPPQELEWTILVLGQYRGVDLPRWTNRFGESLTLEDLLRAELKKPVEDCACGGTHKLFGLTWVYHLHLQKGGKREGVWQEVADTLLLYQQKAKQYQNPDGSFSTSFFRGPGNDPSMQLRMNTTGHTLEWLSLWLTDEELKQQWVQDAANALAMMFLNIQGQAMESGTLYHAVHGLLIYYARVFDADRLGPNRPPVPLPPKGVAR